MAKSTDQAFARSCIKDLGLQVPPADGAAATNHRRRSAESCGVCAMCEVRESLIAYRRCVSHLVKSIFSREARDLHYGVSGIPLSFPSFVRSFRRWCDCAESIEAEYNQWRASQKVLSAFHVERGRSISDAEFTRVQSFLHPEGPVHYPTETPSQRD